MLIRSINTKKTSCFLAVILWIAPALSDPALNQANKEHTAQFDKLLKSFSEGITEAKNNIAQTAQLVRKYNKNSNTGAIVAKIFEASEALDRFLQLKVRPIEHYLQQDLTKISAEDCQKIYAAIDITTIATTHLVEELNRYIQSNFITELTFNFLTNPDELLAVDKNVTLETILQHCDKLNAATESLRETISYIGLPYWKRMCRSIDTYILKPCARYYIPPIASAALLTLCAYWDIGKCVSEPVPLAFVPPCMALLYCENKEPITQWWKRCRERASEEKIQDYNLIQDIIPNYNFWDFDQVIGLEDLKAYFEPVLAYAEDPVKYAQIGAHIRTNYIFYGPPTTSKQFFAVALAGEMTKRNPNIRILRIPTRVFFDVGAEETIALIRSYAPCVVCINEAGTMLPFELLRELGNGNLSPSPDRPVFLILTTSKLEAIDSSVASMGHWCNTILFTLPSFTERMHIIRTVLLNYGKNIDDFDIERLAETTDDCSFVYIKHYIITAILQAGADNVPLTSDFIADVMNKYKTKIPETL